MITLPQSHGFAFSLTGLFCGVFLVSWMSVSNVPGKQVKFRGKASLRRLLLVFGAGKREGGEGATPASVVPDALRVLSRNTQVFLFLQGKEKASLRWLFLVFGAQKRTRTSTPYGTRT